MKNDEKLELDILLGQLDSEINHEFWECYRRITEKDPFHLGEVDRLHEIGQDLLRVREARAVLDKWRGR